MKTIYNILNLGLFIIAFLSIVSCEEEISYTADLNDNRFVVVEGRITNEDKSHLLRVTQSDDYFSNVEPNKADINSLKIIELQTGNIYSISEVDTGIGYYQTEAFKGLIGSEYELSLNFEGETYSAISFLDTVAQMDSVVVEYEFINYFGGAGFYKIKMFALEPDPKGDYYMANLYVNDTLFNSKLSLTTYFDDELINGNNFMGVDRYYLPQEEIMRDTNYIRLELLSISRDEYNFINDFLAETSSNGSLFSGPPADVPTNIKSIQSSKRGFGFFSASATTSEETILYKVHDESTNNPDYKR